MRIGIDVSFLAKDKRGMGRFVKNLLVFLYKARPDCEFILVCDPRVDKLENIKLFFKEPFKYFLACEEIKKHFDVFLFPWGRVDFFPSCPKIVNIYDAVPFVYFNSNFKKDQKRLELAAKHADIVVTTSFFSKKEIVKFLSVKPGMIKVIYPGVDRVFSKLSLGSHDRERLLRELGIRNDFWLFVGSCDRRKNLNNLIYAYKIYKEDTGSDKKLVIAGSPPGRKSLMECVLFKKDLYDVVAECGIKDEVMWIGSVSDEKLNLLYNISHALVFPSLYEGFGFPVAEAMACGLPVICSRESSLPEVGQNAVLYFNPEDPFEISEAAKMLDNDKVLREDLISLSRRAVQKFDFKNCAEEYMKIFESASPAFKGRRTES